MITLKRDSDLFDSSAQTLVNTVNTVGVMGKGIALGFKERFPEMFSDYARRCTLGEVHLGEPYIFKRAVPPWIVNFPTKEHWRSGARLDAITEGLRYLKTHYLDWGITSLAVPPLGCGEGGLDWRIVGPTLYRSLSTFNIPVEIYAPWRTPAEELTDEFLSDPARAAAAGSDSRNPLQPGWVALAEILRRIAAESYHYPIGRVTFQKLAYFATVAGVPTDLRFEKSSYGPFSRTSSKKLIAQLVNNGLIRETPVGQMIRVDPGPTIDDARKRYALEFERWSAPMNRVVDLLVRMNGRQAELAATIHFAATELSAQGRKPTEVQVLDAVMSWKARRAPSFKRPDVAEMIRRLNLARWIDASYSAELPVPADAAA